MIAVHPASSASLRKAGAEADQEQRPRRGGLAGLARLALTGAVSIISVMASAAEQPKPPLPSRMEPPEARASETPFQEGKAIQLRAPDKKRGLPLMEALSVRASAYEWSEKDLLLQDLSDLLWAGNGINRSGSANRTAPSAVNAQDVDIFVFLKRGAFRYDPVQQALDPVCGGDHRAGIDDMNPGSEPAALLILVSDLSRFRVGTQEEKVEWAAIDSGIVSQNLSLFCASTGLGTRPRTDMNKGLIRRLLKLRDTQLPVLNQAVGYPKRAR